MKHTITIFIALFVIVLAIASCQPSTVKFPPEPGTFLGPIGKAGVYPAWASPGANKFIIDQPNIVLQKASVEFTLGGSISDILSVGESKTYTLNNLDYEVNIVAFAANGTEVTVNVNGETTNSMGIGESYTLTDNTTISIDDIFLAGTTMAELKASDDFIWNKFYTLDNTNQWVEHTTTCSLFPNSDWCANLATSDIDIDWATYFDGQNYAVGYTCSILPNNQFDCSGNRWKLIWFNLTEDAAPPTGACSDSDGGSTDIKGTVTVGEQQGTDTCYDPTTNQTVYQCTTGPDCKLMEYSCVNDAMSSSLFSCSIGCSNGACINDTCVDPDGGLDNRTQTIVSFLDMVLQDGCHGKMILQEGYCDDNEKLNKLKMKEIICWHGCANGICLLPSEASPPDLIVDQILAKSNGRLVAVVKNIGAGPVPLDTPVSALIVDASNNQEITGMSIGTSPTPGAAYNYQLGFDLGMHIDTSGLFISTNQQVTATADFNNTIIESDETNNAKTQLAVMGSTPGN